MTCVPLGFRRLVMKYHFIQIDLFVGRSVAASLMPSSSSWSRHPRLTIYRLFLKNDRISLSDNLTNSGSNDFNSMCRMNLKLYFYFFYFFPKKKCHSVEKENTFWVLEYARTQLNKNVQRITNSYADLDMIRKEKWRRLSIQQKRSGRPAVSKEMVEWVRENISVKPQDVHKKSRFGTKQKQIITAVLETVAQYMLQLSGYGKRIWTTSSIGRDGCAYSGNIFVKPQYVHEKRKARIQADNYSRPGDCYAIHVAPICPREKDLDEQLHRKKWSNWFRKYYCETPGCQ